MNPLSPDTSSSSRKKFVRYVLPMSVAFLATIAIGLTRPSCRSIGLANLERENARTVAGQTIGMSPSEAKRFLAKQPAIGQYLVTESPGGIVLTSPFHHPNFGRDSRIRIKLSVKEERVSAFQVVLDTD